MPKHIPYGRQHVTDADIAAVTEALRAEYLTQGPRVPAFETDFAAYVQAPHAVAVATGTAALHLCALALDVKPGQRVLTSPITFAASANCIRHAGAEADFADIDPDTYLLDIAAVRRKLEAAPQGTYAGLVPVDFAGLPVNLEAFRALADEFGLWMIEDACHAPGGAFQASDGTWQTCGNGRFAQLATFSFHPVKHIAAGEGGMITTQSAQLAQRLQHLRTHGITRQPELLHENHGGWYYEMQWLGYNYRLTDFQAALANSQLARASEGLARRQQIAKVYDHELANTPLALPRVPVGRRHAYHLYVVQTPEAEQRRALYDHLRAANIFPQVHYIPVHLQPYYRALGFGPGQFPVAEAYYARCLSLPMFPSLTENEQAFVIEQVRAFFE